MSYQLREDLHYCYAGRQIVFMDLRNDAYFLLAGPLERAFLAYVAGQRVTKEELNHLLGRGLLIEADGTSPRTAGKSVPLPTRSITEQRSEERRGGKECVSTCNSRWTTRH